MNFIKLVTTLRDECGASGTDSTVVSATGEWARLCNWIATSWHEIQEDNKGWEWMRKNVTFDTVAQKGEYNAETDILLTDFGIWKEDSFRAYLKSAGVGNEMLLDFKNYEDFRNFYLFSTRNTTYTRPIEVSIAPNRNLLLGFSPDAVYTVSGEYYKDPVDLVLDTDTPDMPSRFHMAIVYRAMMSYGAFEAASEVYQRGEKGYKEILNKIRFDQAPSISRGGSFI
jgi:hypothetical protein